MITACESSTWTSSTLTTVSEPCSFLLIERHWIILMATVDSCGAWWAHGVHGNGTASEKIVCMHVGEKRGLHTGAVYWPCSTAQW